MPKLSVYVETSVWSCAFAEDVPDYRRDTVAFFDRCREGCFDVSISPLVLDEIDRAPESLRGRLIHLIEEIKPSVLDPTASVDELVTAFMTSKVVPPSKPEDAAHVAYAFFYGLDVLVSWNFRHITNVRRADRFNAVALLTGYHKSLRIVTPLELKDDDELEDV